MYHYHDDADVAMLRDGDCTPQELLLDLTGYSDGPECQRYVNEAMALATLPAHQECGMSAYERAERSADAY